MMLNTYLVLLLVVTLSLAPAFLGTPLGEPCSNSAECKDVSDGGDPNSRCPAFGEPIAKVCICGPGYARDNLVCVLDVGAAVCFGAPPGTCPNGGTCVATDVCSCLSGFGGTTCEPLCFGEPAGTCPNNGICIAPDACTCLPDFGQPRCDPVCFGAAAGTCPNGGTCVSPDVCSCLSGFGGTTCEPVCFGETAGSCANDGTCESPNVCNCPSGYGPPRCDAVCFGEPAGTCPNGGVCVSPDVCACAAGFGGTFCDDIDECICEHCCSHWCENEVGSYHCTCPSPLVLKDDLKTCWNPSTGGEVPNTNDRGPNGCPGLASHGVK